MVYAMQDHNWKIWAAKTLELSKLPLFMSENKNVVGEKSKFWIVLYYCKHYKIKISNKGWDKKDTIM